MALLDAVDALRVHRVAEVQVLGGSHPAAVVPGESDREQSPLLGFGDRCHEVFGVTGCGQRDRDVAIPRVRDDLALEDQLRRSPGNGALLPRVRPQGVRPLLESEIET